MIPYLLLTVVAISIIAGVLYPLMDDNIVSDYTDTTIKRARDLIKESSVFSFDDENEKFEQDLSKQTEVESDLVVDLPESKGDETRETVENEQEQEVGKIDEYEEMQKENENLSNYAPTDEKMKELSFQDFRDSIWSKDHEKLIYYVQQKPEWLFQPDQNYWLPIHEAAIIGCVECVKIMIQAGSSINERTGENMDGGSVLYWVQNLNTVNENGDNENPVLSFLVNEGALLIHPGDRSEFTLGDLRRAGIMGDNRKVLSFGRQRPDFLLIPDENGWTVLHEAVRAGRIDTIEALLRFPNVVENINMRVGASRDGGSAAWLASYFHGDDSVVLDILRRHAGEILTPIHHEL